MVAIGSLMNYYCRRSVERINQVAILRRNTHERPKNGQSVFQAPSERGGVSQCMPNHNANADDSSDAELPTGDTFVDAVVRELQDRGQLEVVAWTLDNRRDMSGLGPRDVAREEGIATDPDDSDAVDHVADAIELGYGDYRRSMKEFVDDNE